MSTSKLEISSKEKALILFADVIDSSKYSSVLGVLEYGKQLLEFKKKFIELGNLLFPEVGDKTIAFKRVEARGDEGVVFYVPDDLSTYPELVFNAVQFALELKAILEIQGGLNPSGTAPRAMQIGIGIHFGEVATVAGSEMNEVKGIYQSIIKDIMGYEINYGKRLESCSRVGKFSNIFLSKDAASLLDGYPIAYQKHNVSLKNIHDNEDAYEVMSAYLDKTPYSSDWSDKEKYLDAFTVKGYNHYSLLRYPWQKGLAVSILDSRYKEALTHSMKAKYSEMLSEIAWRNPVENDPILLFRRAMDCHKDGKLTQSARYLNQILHEHPYFMHAKIKLIRTCWEIAKSKSESAEKIYARDVADEYLHKFPEYLDDEEKELCQRILAK